MPDAKTLTVPYVPFKTFQSVLDSFRSFLPDQIDATMWPSYSGGTRSQLLSALKFLQLIDDRGYPTDALRNLAQADAQHRPEALRAVLRGAYTSLAQLDLTKATPGSFDAEMRKFGQEGDTHRKASSFFLQAAKYAGIPLSPLLTKKGSLAGTRRKRSAGVTGTKAKSAEQAGNGFANAASASPRIGSYKEILLSSGGRMVLTTDKDLFQMNAEDRKFVMDVLVKLEVYEETHPLIEDEEESEEGAQ